MTMEADSGVDESTIASAALVWIKHLIEQTFGLMRNIIYDSWCWTNEMKSPSTATA